MKQLFLAAAAAMAFVPGAALAGTYEDGLYGGSIATMCMLLENNKLDYTFVREYNREIRTNLPGSQVNALRQELPGCPI